MDSDLPVLKENEYVIQARDSQPGTILPLGDIWQHPVISGSRGWGWNGYHYHLLGRGQAVSFLQLVHRQASTPPFNSNNYQIQNANSTIVQKPWSRLRRENQKIWIKC